MNINLNQVTYQSQPITTNGVSAGTLSQGNTSATGGDGVRNIPVPSGMSAQEAGKTLLSSLSVGDSFTGEITNITKNQITISLSDSVQISALLSNALSYNIGDMASFTIKDKAGPQILLQPNPNANINNLMNDQTITNALQSAHLAVNETTVSLVHEMMKQNVPINPQSLTQYARGLENAPSATPEDIVFLNKMSIPVSEENVQALHDYYNYSQEIPHQTEQLSTDLSQALSNLASENPAEAFQLLNDFTASFSEPISTSETLNQVMKPADLDTLATQILSLQEEVEPTTAEDANSAKLSVIEQKNTQIQELAKEIQNGEITPKEAMQKLAQLSESQNLPSNSVKDLFDSKEFKQLSENMLRQEMFINPEDVSKENVKKLFAKIITDHNSMTEKLAEQPKAQELLQDMSQVKNQVDFQNQLNHFMNFVQIPLKMNGQNAHGDLYVYKNKRQKSGDDDELKAALHLDMENLKTLDILVKLKDKNVSTDFKVETDEILTFIESHMEELNSRLRALGYHVNSSVESIGQKSEYSFKKNVLEEELSPTEIKRFSFDVRA